MFDVVCQGDVFLYNLVYLTEEMYVKLSLYTDFILKNTPRVITQVDRDVHSPTYGACDRSYWHLKTRDFNSAILQQTGLAFALLYQIDFPGNIYHKNENLRDWSLATLEYWTKIQLSDGSYNEYYPYEHGFPPTAFSLYSACQIYQRFELNNADIEKKIRKTSGYLCKTYETKAFNQEMASITALFCAYQILKEDWILNGCKQKLDNILLNQTEDGYFPEYGGADLGYLSVALDMLCEYYYLSEDESVIQPIKGIINFIKYFVHPDGTVGGEYGSRNTTYFLPNGIEVALQLGIEDAAAIKEVLYKDTCKYNYFMDSADDRYFSHYLLHSFLRALEKEQKYGKLKEIKELPFQGKDIRYFVKSGLLSYNNEIYSAYVGLQKGGVIKIFNKENELFINCGYRVDYGKGSVAATNWQDSSYEVSFESDKATINGNMNKVKLKIPSTILHMGLRVVSFICGSKIIGFLKRQIILVDKHVNVKFRREIVFSDDCIEITDTINSPLNITLESASNMSLRHVASGKFFMTSDLMCEPYLIKENAKEVKVSTKFSVLDSKITQKIE